MTDILVSGYQTLCLWCRGWTPARGLPREGKHYFHTNMLQLPVGGGRESSSRKLPRLQTCEGIPTEAEITENTQDDNGKGVHFFTTLGMSFAAALRGRTEEQKQPQTHQVAVAVAGPATVEPRVPAALPNMNRRQLVSQFWPPI
jgi:hypothetical protein